MTGLAIVVAAVLVAAGLYWANRLDGWEEDRELDWRIEDSLRRAREALDRSDQPIVFDQEVA